MFLCLLASVSFKCLAKEKQLDDQAKCILDMVVLPYKKKRHPQVLLERLLVLSQRYCCIVCHLSSYLVTNEDYHLS